MQTVEVKLWDDLHAKAGEKVPSDEQCELELKTRGSTRRVKLDLTGPHYKELADLLAPYFAAGAKVDTRPTGRFGFTAGSREAREFYAGLRAWADTQGRSAEYENQHTRGGRKKNYYYPDKLVADYEAYLLEQARGG